MVFLGMKRGREGELDSITTMANCLMLLSRSAGATAFESATTTTTTSPSRVFECKTCSRQFPSFQALGGHRASHKKPRLMGGGDMNIITQTSPPKPKTHECSICGLEFAIGQALGGHMRRHRAAATATATTALSSDSHVTDLSLSSSQSQEQVPVVKKSNSRTVLCLDLNLTPLENDSDLVPMIHCFL